VFNGLVFEDQYLEISTQLSPNANLYGIGEHVKPLRLNTTGFLYTLWANGTKFLLIFCRRISTTQR
jgi:alpha-glucosidase (family GH31 glycosyl hydrolase)